MVVANFLVLDPLLKGLGHSQVMMFPRPEIQLSPSEVLVLAKRRLISAGSSLRAKSPKSAQPTSLREPGTQDPAGLQAPQAARTAGTRSHRLHPRQTATSH